MYTPPPSIPVTVTQPVIQTVIKPKPLAVIIPKIKKVYVLTKKATYIPKKQIVYIKWPVAPQPVTTVVRKSIPVHASIPTTYTKLVIPLTSLVVRINYSPVPVAQSFFKTSYAQVSQPVTVPVPTQTVDRRSDAPFPVSQPITVQVPRPVQIPVSKPVSYQVAWPVQVPVTTTKFVRRNFLPVSTTITPVPVERNQYIIHNNLYIW